LIVWLSGAIANRDAQVDYIAQDNPSAAIEQGDKVASHVSQLAAYPKLGRVGRKKGTRELVISGTPFIVIYRISGKSIQILRLLHGAQNFSG
jgi:toxin ParE1/3/4